MGMRISELELELEILRSQLARYQRRECSSLVPEREQVRLRWLQLHSEANPHLFVKCWRCGGLTIPKTSP